MLDSYSRSTFLVSLISLSYLGALVDRFRIQEASIFLLFISIYLMIIIRALLKEKKDPDDYSPLYSGYKPARAVFSNVSSFLSLSVLAMYMLAPSCVQWFSISHTRGLNIQPPWCIPEIYFFALSPLIGFAILAFFFKRNPKLCDSPFYTKIIEDHFGGLVAKLVKWAISLSLLSILISEIVYFNLIGAELFNSPESYDYRLITIVMICICFIYLRSRYYEGSLITDTVQFSAVLALIILASFYALTIDLDVSSVTSAIKQDSQLVNEVLSKTKSPQDFSSGISSTIGVMLFSYPFSIAGICIIIICWVVSLPSLWILNFYSMKRWAKAEKKQVSCNPLILSGIFTVPFMLFFSSLGFRLVYLGFKKLTFYYPEYAFQWSEFSSSQLFHLSHVLATFVHYLQSIPIAQSYEVNNLWPNLVTVGVISIVFLFFQTTFDTLVFTLVQIGTTCNMETDQIKEKESIAKLLNLLFLFSLFISVLCFLLEKMNAWILKTTVAMSFLVIPVTIIICFAVFGERSVRKKCSSKIKLRAVSMLTALLTAGFFTIIWGFYSRSVWNSHYIAKDSTGMEVPYISFGSSNLFFFTLLFILLYIFFSLVLNRIGIKIFGCDHLYFALEKSLLLIPVMIVGCVYLIIFPIFKLSSAMSLICVLGGFPVSACLLIGMFIFSTKHGERKTWLSARLHKWGNEIASVSVFKNVTMYLVLVSMLLAAGIVYQIPQSNLLNNQIREIAVFKTMNDETSRFNKECVDKKNRLIQKIRSGEEWIEFAVNNGWTIYVTLFPENLNAANFKRTSYYLIVDNKKIFEDKILAALNRTKLHRLPEYPLFGIDTKNSKVNVLALNFKFGLTTRDLLSMMSCQPFHPIYSGRENIILSSTHCYNINKAFEPLNLFGCIDYEHARVFLHLAESPEPGSFFEIPSTRFYPYIKSRSISTTLMITLVFIGSLLLLYKSDPIPKKADKSTTSQ